MMHNKRPPMLASELPPNLINLRAGEKRSAVCLDCGRWRLLHRSMVKYHKADASFDADDDEFAGSRIDLGGWTYQGTLGFRF